MPWNEIHIEGDFHSILSDIQLPSGGAPSDQVYFVANSAMAGGDPAFLAWDGAAWVRLGGSSSGGIPFGSTFPVGGAAGDVFLRTDLGRLFTFRAGAWQDMQAVAGPVAVDDPDAGPIVTQPPTNVIPWTDQAYTEMALVIHNEGLWQSIEDVANGDPEPGTPRAFPLTLTLADNWPTDLAVATAQLVAAGIGSYAEVRNGDVANANLGTPAEGVTFPDQHNIVWTGDSTLNVTTNEGWTVTQGFLFLPVADAAATITFHTGGPWRQLARFNSTFVGPAAPASPSDGMIWIKDDDGTARIRASGKWNRFDQQVHIGGTPAVKNVGDLVYNPSTRILSIWKGTAWEHVNIAVETTSGTPQNVHSGMLWLDGNELKVFVGNQWQTLIKKNIQINVSLLNVNQSYNAFAPQRALEVVEIEGSIYVDGAASSKLELIGQNPSGWIDWGTGIVGGDVDTTAFVTDANFSPSNWYPAGKGWDSAGAEISDVPWWNGRWLDVKISLHHFPGITLLKWDVFGKDGNGNRRWTRGTVRYSRELFPIIGIGLKTINAATSKFYYSIDAH
jgi:hypothetical protein